MQTYDDPVLEAIERRSGVDRNRFLLAWGKRIDGESRVYTAENAERLEGQESATNKGVKVK